MPAYQLSAAKIAELRAKAAAIRAARANSGDTNNGNSTSVSESTPGQTAVSIAAAEIVRNNQDPAHASGSSISPIQWNAEQIQAIKLAASGSSFVLTGAAGTGKTTCTKGCIETIISSNKHLPLNADGHKYLDSGTPGIVCTAYTRRAVRNIRKAMPEDIKSNCITIHKLLEYGPVFYEVTDSDGNTRRTMRFEPSRSQYLPLPSSIHTLIIDEASMVSVELFNELLLALPHNPTIIFIGDIQQLPPVFGSAILGFKLLSLPVVELTHVYRQALESPIIRLAHRILSGNPIPADEYPDWYNPNQLKIHPWKKKLSADVACATACKFLTGAIESNIYDPEEDIVLCPFNKSFGTIELNAAIANYLGKQRGATVYEVICGFDTKYLAVGDRILFDKEDAVITNIQFNSIYGGRMPLEPSTRMDRWGSLAEGEQEHHIIQTDDDIDAMLQAMVSADSDERKKSASHEITIRFLESDREETLSSVGDVSAIDLGYALTVHKSQGSEWRRVFFMTHASHATMLQRELIYTAVTRAKEELYWICEPETLTKAVLNQRIVGNTIEEKAEFFKGKLDANELQLVTRMKL